MIFGIIVLMGMIVGAIMGVLFGSPTEPIWWLKMIAFFVVVGVGFIASVVIATSRN